MKDKDGQNFLLLIKSVPFLEVISSENVDFISL